MGEDTRDRDLGRYTIEIRKSSTYGPVLAMGEVVLEQYDDVGARTVAATVLAKWGEGMAILATHQVERLKLRASIDEALAEFRESLADVQAARPDVVVEPDNGVDKEAFEPGPPDEYKEDIPEVLVDDAPEGIAAVIQ